MGGVEGFFGTRLLLQVPPAVSHLRRQTERRRRGGQQSDDHLRWPPRCSDLRGEVDRGRRRARERERRREIGSVRETGDAMRGSPDDGLSGYTPVRPAELTSCLSFFPKNRFNNQSNKTIPIR